MSENIGYWIGVQGRG